MEKIIVNPLNVRGLGNVVDADNVMGEYNSLLTSVSDSTYGSVWNSEYLTGSYITLSYDRVIADIGDLTVSLTLKDNTDTVIGSASVTCYFEDNTYTATTNNSGVASFTLTVTEEGYHTFKIVYEGTNSVAGCIKTGIICCLNPTDITLVGDKTLTQTGDTTHLFSTVTSNTLPVQGARVNFMKYNPNLFTAGTIYTNTTGNDAVTLNKNIGQSWCVKTTNFVTIGATSNNKIEIYHNALTVLSGGTALVDAVELTEKKLTLIDKVLYYNDTSVDLSSTSIDLTKLVRHQGTVNVCYSIDKFYTANDGRTTTSIDETGITVNGLSTSLYNYWVRVDSGTNVRNLFGPLTISFTVVSATGTIRLYTVNNRDYGTDDYLETYKTLSNLGATSNKDVKIVIDGETVQYYVNDSLVATDDFVWSEAVGFGLRGYENSSVKFKNFNIGGY